METHESRRDRGTTVSTECDRRKAAPAISTPKRSLNRPTASHPEHLDTSAVMRNRRVKRVMDQRLGDRFRIHARREAAAFQHARIYRAGQHRAGHEPAVRELLR